MPSKSKRRISITILPQLDELMIQIAKKTGKSKSALIESALQKFLKDKLEEDAKFIASQNCPDLPNEEEWSTIQFETLHHD